MCAMSSYNKHITLIRNTNVMANFKHYDLQLIYPDFIAPLTDLIIELDYLRKKPLAGSTHPKVFFQLKSIFHMLESIGSARIEGNRTTIVEFIETKIEDKQTVKPEGIIEIQNMEQVMSFIEDNVQHAPINKMFLSELHKQVVKGLTKEGSQTPGLYRKRNVQIARSTHLPPDFTKVEDYMEECFNFINQDDPPKSDLLKTAILHHRFAWIHPFDNGNGRTVRLLTYAMLVKQGFNVQIGGRIVNPTAVFCNDREKYYTALSWADTGTREGILSWCEYVLQGLKQEIEKVDNLVDYNYLSRKILLPAIAFSLERKVITKPESKILRVAVEKQVFQASDIKHLFPGKIPAELSRMLRGLKEKKMIQPETENGRKYIMRFDNNYLLRGIIHALGENGFLPDNEVVN